LLACSHALVVSLSPIFRLSSFVSFLAATRLFFYKK
jgi:hypothetical protein